MKESESLKQTMKFVAEWNAKSSKNGIERYIEEQKEEAATIAENNKSLKVAKNMLNDDVDIQTIMKYTGLSTKEIKKLQKNV